jgi:hypothetical protein
MWIAGSYPAWGTMRLKGRVSIVFPSKKEHKGVVLYSDRINIVEDEDYEWLKEHPEGRKFSFIRKVGRVDYYTSLENWRM